MASQKIDPAGIPVDGPQPATDSAIGIGQAGGPRPPSIQPVQLEMGWHTVLAAAAALFLGLGLLAAVWLLARPLAILILSLSIAGALSAPVAWIEHRLPRLAAIILVHLLIVAAVVGLGALVVPPLLEQVSQINEALPDFTSWLQGRLDTLGIRNVNSILDELISTLSGFGQQIVMLPMTIAGILLDIMLIFFLSIYSLMAGPALLGFIKSLFPAARRARVEEVADEMVGAMGGYVRGVVLTGTFVGILTYVGLRLIDVPYPLVLSVLAGLLELIPVVGTTISMITLTGVALTSSITKALMTFLYMGGVQIVEGNILFPNIVGRETHASPLLSLFAFFAGMTVGGIIGGVIGVPLAAVLRVLVVEIVAPAVRRWSYGGEQPQTSDSPA